MYLPPNHWAMTSSRSRPMMMAPATRPTVLMSMVLKRDGKSYPTVRRAESTFVMMLSAWCSAEAGILGCGQSRITTE